MRLSLRAAISALTALVVTIVAVSTLSVSLVYTSAALRRMGERHADAVLQTAAPALASSLSYPANAADAVQADVAAGTFPFPSGDATGSVARGLLRAHVAVERIHAPSVDVVASILVDGTLISSAVHPETGNLLCRATVVRNGTVEAVNGTESGAHNDTEYYMRNHSRVPDAYRGGAAPLLDFRHYFATPAMAALAPLGKRTLWLGVHTSLYVHSFGDRAFLRFGLNAIKALHNASGTFLGFVSASLTLDQFDAMLAASVVGGAHAFAVDVTGYLLGSSHPAPWRDTYEVPVGTNATRGCAVRVADGNASLAFAGCRTHASAYAYAPLRHVARETDFLSFTGAAGAGDVRVGGTLYYVARDFVVPVASTTFRVLVVVTLPHEDVLGNVHTGRNIAIGISAAVFVVATLAAFVAVHLLLKPLADVSRRMHDAAALQDTATSADSGLSVITEVRELQESYDTLHAQLSHLRAFVPITVVAHLKAQAAPATQRSQRRGTGDSSARLYSPRADDDEMTSRTGGSEANASLGVSRTTTGRASLAASQSADSDRGSAATRRPLLPAKGLNTAIGVLDRNVAVVLLNLRGFNAHVAHAFGSGETSTFLRSFAAFIDTVADVASAHNGVLDSFHGDRALLTFNAARRVRDHTASALDAALDIAASPRALNLPVLCAVATGRALVGNLGGDGTKRFHTIGSCVHRAATLLRVAPGYDVDAVPAKSIVPPASRVLVSGSAVRNARTARFCVCPLDYAALDGVGSAGTPIASVYGRREDVAAVSDQWVYTGNGSDDGRAQVSDASPLDAPPADAQERDDAMVAIVDYLAAADAAGAAAAFNKAALLQPVPTAAETWCVGLQRLYPIVAAAASASSNDAPAAISWIPGRDTGFY